MRCLQGFRDLHGERPCVVHRQRAPERLALHVLHHKVIGSEIVELADAGMIQGRDGARFAHESPGMLGLEALDRDDAIDSCVESLPDLAHPTCAEGADDFVRAESRAWSEIQSKGLCRRRSDGRGGLLLIHGILGTAWIALFLTQSLLAASHRISARKRMGTVGGELAAALAESHQPVRSGTSDKTFADSNVLIYAHDVDAGRRHEIARGLLRDLWVARTRM